MQDLQKILQNTFGLENFREGQEEIISSVVSGSDTIVFMPTWGWKSLTYQLPTMARKWVAIIISPLISLMKDQVDKLNELWMRAELINSTISYSEQQMILNELSATTWEEVNPIKFLYIAPERLNSGDFLRVLQKTPIALIAIDEAHCISQWWHDFRPSYMKIKGFIENLRNAQQFPVIALTATATKKVRADIVERIGLTKYNTFTKGFDRKNIITIVRELSKKEEKMQKLYEIIKNTPGSWIVYCSSRKVTKEVYDFLCENDISVGIYTGEMSANDRENMQQNFMDSKLKVIVATNAFGMGIDKKDIRFVVHYNLPGSIENYYQEVGRAGRDGKKSFWVVIASYWDTKIQEFFIENSYPPKEEILQLYDYLYSDFKNGEWSGTQIQKTYMQMAWESRINNDLKVWTIIKILEKYGILRRGISGEMEDNFRGRGLTLIQDKRKHDAILIDWKHQELLKNESYFKLEQIKKLLFYPSCRKRFILEYFGDEDDLKNLPDNCGLCDYCLEKSKLQSGDLEYLVHLSVFEIVLDAIKTFDKKYGVKLMTKFLRGSSDARIEEWGLDRHEMYGALSEYNSELVEALLEALIQYDYLEKTTGQYPLVGLTKVGFAALKREEILKDDEENLQQYLLMRVKSWAFKKAKKSTSSTKTSKPRGETYRETKELFQNLSTEFSEYEIVKEISKQREMAITTVEWHLVKLYEGWEIMLNDIMKLTSFARLKSVKQVVAESFSWKVEKLKPVKEVLEENGNKEVSYFDIKLALVMIEKGDL